ncbi:hypothetical protein R75471_07258 [Paraburkholderia domus]|nr:hypothetical protein R75471_07258 [Paraburkholderia domus]
MKALAITSAVQAFRAYEMHAAYNRVCALSPYWKRQRELLTNEMKAVDARVAAYRASLGLPDHTI